MPRVLVTGAAGQLGAELVRELRARGRDDAVAATRADADLSDGAAAALDRYDFDLLINCAAYTRVDDAESHPDDAFALNAHAVRDLAALCRRKEASFVTFSTDYVFDGRDERPYAEDADPAPLNVYGASKLAGEALARAEWPEGTVVIRTASLFGTGPARDGADAKGGARSRNFVDTMIAAASEGRALRVVDDVVMSPTWTGHLAPAVLDLLDVLNVHERAAGGIWHLAGGGAASWHALAVAALEAAGLDAEVAAVPSSSYPTPARRPRYSVLDCGRAASLGVRLPEWRAGLTAYVRAREAWAGEAGA